MPAPSGSGVENLDFRLQALEAESAIRRLVARYMEICDDLGPEAPMKELGGLFCKDAVWEGQGSKYAGAFGAHRGRQAIVDFLDTYRAPTPHFASNVHFLTSESITVGARKASGRWVMLQAPSFANGESFVLAARLTLDFALEAGAWRISRFRTTNLFGRPVAGGWHAAAPIPTPPPSIEGK